MKNKLQKISIPSPCHENWASMTATEKGRFCASCQKVVHDFTKSSDREIAQTLAKGNNLCGRFNMSQLNRDLIVAESKRSWLTTGAAAVAVLALGTNEAIAQNPVPTEQAPAEKTGEIIKGKVAPPVSKAITGTVYDEEGLPLPGANITIKGTTKSTQSNFDGNFHIEASTGDVLEVSFVGFDDSTYAITEDIDNVVIKLTEHMMILGDIMYVKRRTFFGRIFHSIGNIFRKDEE